MYVRSTAILCGLAALLVSGLLTPAALAARNVTISNASTSNMGPGIFSNIRLPIADNGVLNISDMAGLLAVDDLYVDTNVAGLQAGDILVDDTATFTTSNNLGLFAAGTAILDWSVTITGGGNLEVTGNSQINARQQAHDLKFNGPATFGGIGGALEADASIQFSDAVNGALPLSFTSGTDVSFLGNVGSTTPPTSLTIDGGTIVRNTSIETVEIQDYEGPLTLGVSTGPSAHGFNCGVSGSVLFADTVNGASTDHNYDLDTACPLVQFNGIVGGIAPPATVDITDSGQTTLSTASITTTGAQSYSGPLVVQSGESTMSGTSVTLSDDVTLNTGADLRVSGTTTIGNGTVTGSGSITKIGAGIMTLAGTHASTGEIRNDGSDPINITGSIAADVTAASGTVLGTGETAGTLSAQSGGAIQPGTQTPLASQVLTAGSLSLATGSFYLPQMLAANSPKIRAASVTLGGANLQFENSAAPAMGSVQEIIDNTGVAPVSGTFNGLPEGGITFDDNIAYQVSYVAGDGNDVSLTRVARPAEVVTTQSVSSSTLGESVRFTVTVDGVTPTGTVTFLVDGNAQTPVALNSGTASFTTSSLATGTRSIRARYDGDSDDALSTSVAVQHVVNQLVTTTTLASSKPTSVVGESVTLTATITNSSPGATGTVTFFDGSTSIGTAQVGAGGSVSITTSSLTKGTHSLTATYSGSTDHTASTSSAVTYSVATPARLGTVTVTGPSKAKKGKSLRYRVRIQNSGQQPLAGVSVRVSGKGVKASATAGAVKAGSIATTTVRIKPTKKGKIRMRFSVSTTSGQAKTVTRTITVT